MFQEAWPGYLRFCTPKGNRKPYWRWRIASTVAVGFLFSIKDYVRGSKTQQVRLAIEFQAQKTREQRVSRTDGYRARQWDYYERMKQLNVRGLHVGAQLRLLPDAETRQRKAR